MLRLLNLSEALRNLADSGTDNEIHRALELCYAFMERIERLTPDNPPLLSQERLPNAQSPFVN
jgi:hypothetical protein